MKIFLKLPGGGEFYLESNPRRPMERERFYTMAALAAFVMVLAFLETMLLF